MDVDRWWKLREGMPLEVTVQVTVKPARFEMSYRRINSLQKPLMIRVWHRGATKRIDRMPTRALVPFFAIAFGLSWGILALFIGFTAQAEAVFGKMGYTNPLFILAVYAPAIAAVFLVWRHQGLAGLGRFAKRLTLWRMPWPWWALLVFGVPAVSYVGAALKGTPWMHRSRSRPGRPCCPRC
jgi:hypothetical protein